MLNKQHVASEEGLWTDSDTKFNTIAQRFAKSLTKAHILAKQKLVKQSKLRFAQT